VPVRELWRYPVKSLGGERLASGRVLLRGIEGDRCHGLLGRGGRPVTAREAPGLVRLRAAWEPDALPTVYTANGCEHRWGATDLGAELEALAGPCRPYTIPAGAFDAWPLLLLGTGSVAAVAELAGRPLDARRFRANLLCDLPEPFVEDDWIGRVVVVGDAIVRVLERCTRCSVATLDPDTAEAWPELLDVLRAASEAALERAAPLL
jgi:uncharacterized protein YcbX